MVSFILNEHDRLVRFGTHRRRYNAAPAINSTPVTLGLTFRKKNSAARNAVDFLQSPATAGPRGNREARLVYTHRI